MLKAVIIFLLYIMSIQTLMPRRYIGVISLIHLALFVRMIKERCIEAILHIHLT